MITRLIEKFISATARIVLPSPPTIAPKSFGELDPPSDGRVFAWVRVRGPSMTPVQPVILIDRDAGPKWEMVTTVVLQPSQYHMTITELAAMYPAPRVK